QRLDAPSLPLTVAFLEGGREDLGYVFDGVQEGSEALFQVRKSASSDSEMRRQLFLTSLSDQPIGRDRRNPVSPRYLLTAVDLDLAASDGKTAKISVLETLVPQAIAQRIYRFDLYNTKYAVVGLGRLEPRSFHVTRVTDDSDRPLLFDHRNGEVL